MVSHSPLQFARFVKMRSLKTFIWFFLLAVNSCASGKEINYTASTPAGAHVRYFLDISQSDSIDFIRWNLKIINLKDFNLSCNYGISKPNTNGFIDQKNVSFTGKLELKNNIISLYARDKSLSFHMLNQNILHILDQNKNLMKGNDGWSYTLNAVDRNESKEININPFKNTFKDSIVFVGRTPCSKIGDVVLADKSPNCYKIKWLVYLYKPNPFVDSGSFKMGMRGTAMGVWKIQPNDQQHTIYRLELKNGKYFHLVQVDENIVYILDQNNEILVGDLDFSYSLTAKHNK